jgi:NAD(P)-dependent dehydrogenase (short-subunit alcohol dehydrogenase family)
MIAQAGAVFVTGCDSGMGFWTAALLAARGYTVFAGCFDAANSAGALRAHAAGAPADRLHCVPLDVTSDASVAAAAAAVRAECAARGLGLVGIINCAGVGYNGPAEYFPMDMYKRQMEVHEAANS